MKSKVFKIPFTYIFVRIDWTPWEKTSYGNSMNRTISIGITRPWTNRESLSYKTRAGDNQALAERIKHTKHKRS